MPSVSVTGGPRFTVNVTAIADQMNGPARLRRLISDLSNDRIPSALGGLPIYGGNITICINDGHARP